MFLKKNKKGLKTVNDLAYKDAKDSMSANLRRFRTERSRVSWALVHNLSSMFGEYTWREALEPFWEKVGIGKEEILYYRTLTTPTFRFFVMDLILVNEYAFDLWLDKQRSPELIPAE